MKNLEGHWLYEILIEKNIIMRGNFILKSGRKSNFYIDLRKLISYPKIFEQIAFVISEKLKNLDFDRICAVPTAALPIATLVALNLKKPMIYYIILVLHLRNLKSMIMQNFQKHSFLQFLIIHYYWVRRCNVVNNLDNVFLNSTHNIQERKHKNSYKYYHHLCFQD